MSKAYVVVDGDCDGADFQIYLFSSKEKAQRFCEELVGDRNNDEELLTTHGWKRCDDKRWSNGFSYLLIEEEEIQ